jgi:hypothetical protein
VLGLFILSGRSGYLRFFVDFVKHFNQFWLLLLGYLFGAFLFRLDFLDNIAHFIQFHCLLSLGLINRGTPASPFEVPIDV